MWFVVGSNDAFMLSSTWINGHEHSKNQLMRQPCEEFEAESLHLIETIRLVLLTNVPQRPTNHLFIYIYQRIYQKAIKRGGTHDFRIGIEIRIRASIQKARNEQFDWNEMVISNIEHWPFEWSVCALKSAELAFQCEIECFVLLTVSWFCRWMLIVNC